MVHDDGKVRLVQKDWPVLGPVSVVAARMALACKYQDKYLQAHEALIGVNSKLTEPRIRELLDGIDVDRATRDLETNGKAIDTILARNNDQATAFGFNGTPSFIVGKFRVPGVLTMEQFGMAIADARKAAEKEIAATRSTAPSPGGEGERFCGYKSSRIENLGRYFADYFDDRRIQSSWARVFSACQSVAATSQFAMVRLACATWPLATVEVCVES